MLLDHLSDGLTAIRTRFGAIQARKKVLDCFAEPVIGRAFRATRWLAMTALRYSRDMTPHLSFRGASKASESGIHFSRHSCGAMDSG